MSETPAEFLTGTGFIIFVVLFGGFILFLILRELVLWYWRINDFYQVCQSIDSKLGNIASAILQNGRITSSTSDPAPPLSSKIRDPKLKEVMEQLEKEQPY